MGGGRMFYYIGHVPVLLEFQYRTGTVLLDLSGHYLFLGPYLFLGGGGHGGRVRSGASWADNGNHNCGWSPDSAQEALQDAVVPSSVAGVCQLDPRQGQVCGHWTLGSQHSSGPSRNAGKG